MKAANCVGARVVTWLFYTFINVWNTETRFMVLLLEHKYQVARNLVLQVRSIFIFSMPNNDGNIYGFSHLLKPCAIKSVGNWPNYIECNYESSCVYVKYEYTSSSFCVWKQCEVDINQFGNGGHYL